ncbi:MAG: TonB family protein [Chitinophagaceae bacterium]|nr:MAG: TonB family protein [Chitinophagaceae bacterium]
MIWAHYILQVNIYLILFFAFYKLFLDKETYFNFNRIFLVGSAILSLAIPFLRINWFTQQEATQHIYARVEQLNTFVVSLTAPAPVVEQQFDWGSFLVLIYITGIILLFVRFLWQLITLKRNIVSPKAGMAFSFFSKKVVDDQLPQGDVINRHEDLHIRQYHTVDVLFFEIMTIFLWFNPVIYLYKNTIKCIHEYLADQEAAFFYGDKESYSMLLLSKAFNVSPQQLSNSFFNQSLIKRRIFMLHKQRSKKVAVLKYGLFVPLFGFALILSSATVRENVQLREVADQLPIAETISEVTASIPKLDLATIHPIKEVEILVVKKISEASANDFAVFLQRSIRYPVQAIKDNLQGNTLISFTVSKGNVNNLKAVAELGGGCDTEIMRVILNYKKFSDMADGTYALPVKFNLSGSDSPVINETLPQGQGTQLKMVYVNAISPNSTGADELAEVRVIGTGIKRSNIVSVTGSPIKQEVAIVLDNVLQPASLELSEIPVAAEEIKAVNIMKGPGAVSLYGARAKNGVIEITTTDAPRLASIRVVGQQIETVQQDEKVYDYVNIEVLPQYPGGLAKFRQFIVTNLKYPKAAMEVKRQGTVYVGFTVEKDGSLTNVGVERKVGLGLDEEAIRVVRSSPKWVPGVQNGRPVRVKFNVPVKFTMK